MGEERLKVDGSEAYLKRTFVLLVKDEMRGNDRVQFKYRAMMYGLIKWTSDAIP